MTNRWEKEDDEYILASAGKVPVAKIADKLNKSSWAVRQRAKWLSQFMERPVSLGLVGQYHHHAKVTDHEVTLAKALYADGVKRSVIAEKLEVNYRTVYDWTRDRTRSCAI